MAERWQSRARRSAGSATGKVFETTENVIRWGGGELGAEEAVDEWELWRARRRASHSGSESETFGGIGLLVNVLELRGSVRHGSSGHRDTVTPPLSLSNHHLRPAPHAHRPPMTAARPAAGPSASRPPLTRPRLPSFYERSVCVKGFRRRIVRYLVQAAWIPF
ncbi:hypothetical protein DFH09DRAFT_1070942 [Mycena vulgaris]|nr:hypothetical protein DFH09DRAFT_1070942 [Mycena vulgaris]